MSHLSLSDLPARLAFLDARRSVPARHLTEPAPDEPTLLRLLQSAVRVPDHGRRTPWRFLAIRGDARHALGERLAARGRERDPHAKEKRAEEKRAEEMAAERDRNRFSHAPLVVTVIARLGPDAKVPEQERLLSAGCVSFALLQATQAAGFGAQWLTGWPTYDREVMRWLGLAEDERIVGFIHIGTPSQEAVERDRPDPRTLLSEWTP